MAHFLLVFLTTLALLLAAGLYLADRIGAAL